MQRLIWLAVLIAACGGAAATHHVVHEPSPPASDAPTTSNPCIGDALELESLASCRVERSDPPPLPPPPSHLAMEVAVDGPVASGAEATIAVVLRNEHSEAIIVHLDLACSGFEVQVLNDAEERVDLEEVPLLGALCGAGGPVQATLLPGGQLRTSLTLHAVKRRMTCDDDGACGTTVVGPIPPGTYTLRVRTPIDDCVNEDGTRVCTPRTVSAPLEISTAVPVTDAGYCGSDADCVLHTRCCSCPAALLPLNREVAEASTQSCARRVCAACDEADDRPTPTGVRCAANRCEATFGD